MPEWDKAAGEAKELEGKLTDDEVREGQGKAQGAWGDAQEKGEDVAEEAKDKVDEGKDQLRDRF